YLHSSHLAPTFFAYALSDYLYLHSFPTRRSSDLHRGSPCAASAGGTGDARHGRGEGVAEGVGRRRDGLRADERGEGSAAAIVNRSEEHTSELQSPDHLVCRLLLEKKKKTKRMTDN